MLKVGSRSAETWSIVVIKADFPKKEPVATERILPRCIDARRAAEYVGLSPNTLAKYRCLGGGPRFIKLGARVVYDIADLDAWLSCNLHSSTIEARLALNGA